MPVPRLPDDPTRFVAMYQKGICTASEFAHAAVAAVTAANANSFLDSCPADLLPLVQTVVTRCPADDDDAKWAASVAIGGGNPRGQFDEAELQQQDAEQRQAFRNGVCVLRVVLAKRRELPDPTSGT